MSEYSQHVNISYPASWPIIPDAHCTVMYLGQIDELNYTADDVVDAIRGYSSGILLHAKIRGLEMFGPDNDIPVFRLDEPTLEPRMRAIQAALHARDIRSTSEYYQEGVEYKPHVTWPGLDIKETIQIPKYVLLTEPELWWGDERHDLGGKPY